MNNRMTEEQAMLISAEITRVALLDKSALKAIRTHLDLSDSEIQDLQNWLKGSVKLSKAITLGGDRTAWSLKLSKFITLSRAEWHAFCVHHNIR
jgi:hypothetical protein